MALALPPRVLETSITTGTGTLTLAGAVTGWQSFAAVGDGNTCYYVAHAVDADGVPTGDWEEGLGTYTAAGTTLARTTVIRSSNADAAVDFAAGTKYVAVVRPSEGTSIVRKIGASAGADEFQINPATGAITYLSSNFVDLTITGPASSEMYFAATGGRRARLNNTYLAVGSALSIGILADADPFASSLDTAMTRAAAGVWRDTNGSTGIGKRLTAKLVEANTAGSGAPNVLTAIESRTVLTNEGATAQNYHTLPTAAAGLEFEFVVQDSDGIRVVAGADDTIQDVGTVSGAAGFIQSTTVGSTLRLLAINAVQWVVMSKMGTWTIDA